MKKGKIIWIVIVGVLLEIGTVLQAVYSGAFSNIISLSDPLSIFGLFKLWQFYVLVGIALAVLIISYVFNRLVEDKTNQTIENKSKVEDNGNKNRNYEIISANDKKIDDALTKKMTEIIGKVDADKDYADNMMTLRLFDELYKTREKVVSDNNPNDPYTMKFKRIDAHSFGTAEDHHRNLVWAYYNCLEMSKDFDYTNKNTINYFLTISAYKKVAMIASEENNHAVLLANAFRDFSESTLSQARQIEDNEFELVTANTYVIKYLYKKELNEVAIVDFFENDNQEIVL